MSLSRPAGVALVVLVIAGAVALWLRGCSDEAEPRDWSASLGGRGPDVVLIVVCTLRPDHLPFYGYDQETAPFLNKLAARSTVFENAFSPSGWTAPSTASLHTGVYPRQHGVIFGMAHTRLVRRSDPTIVLNRIPDDFETMAETLGAAGYSTFAVTDNLNICKLEGFAQGFDRFQNFHYKGGAEVVDKLLEWKDEIKAAERSFVYLNFFDPHLPYHKRRGWYPEDEPDLEKEYQAKPGTTPEQLREQVIRAYDSEIHYLDGQLERLFSHFDWQDNAIVLLTADHGEEFQEHGGWEHGFTLYQETVHVPLLFHAPDLGIESRRITANASLIDILPTLRDLLALEPSPIDEGRSFAAALTGNDAAQDMSERFLFGDLQRRESVASPAIHERYAVRGSWKYLTSKARPPALFDLAVDPFDQNNVIDANRERAIEHLQALRHFEEDAIRYGNETVEIQATEELLEELKQLGYVK